MTDEERQTHLLISEVESGINALEFQKKRMLNYELLLNENVSPTHDADFYMVVLRRLFRIIEKYAKNDSSVANLKGKFQHLYEKIKIRDHFEHEVNYENFQQISPGIIVVCGLVNNQTNPHIVSGDKQWLLFDDHKSIIDLMNQFLRLINMKK
ncbi:MAG: hypothetical protein WAR79_20255 [Melioribacteraceae bacterium]